MAHSPAVTITTLDLHFLGAPCAIAAYLVRGPAGPVLVETGPGATVPTLIQALAAHGLAPRDVQHVLVTHIHLDHAGAAGWWARQGAMVYVHPFGAPHLVRPEKLLASARRIYGDDMDRLWGEFLPAPAANVRAVAGGDAIEAAGLRFTAHETPGHARHHLVYQLGDVAFVGDLAGVLRPGSPHLRLPTPPPEFELEAWLASLDRVRALGMRRIYLTHFGAVDNPATHWARVAELLPEYAGRVRAGLAAGRDRAALLADFDAWEQARLAADGVPAADWPVFASLGPVTMTVDGLTRYWTQRE
jgi:glyoxylase-like metal-dependent hydrolase (beta-lactamase superfamily II)